MVDPVHVPKASNGITGLQSSLVRRAARYHTIHLGERGSQHSSTGQTIIDDRGRRSSSSRRIGGCSSLRTLKIGKVVVQALLEMVHHVFMVISQMDDSYSRRSY